MILRPLESARLRATLDIIATVLTIGTCILACVVLVPQVLKSRSPAAAPAVVVGTVLKPIADQAYGASRLTVLVGLSSTCRFCTESIPAFRLLNDFVQSPRGKGVRVLAVGLESPEVLAEYVQANGLTEFESRSVARDSEGARVASRTPTLIVVDDAGKVLVSWSGRMSTEEMDQVLRRNIGPSVPD